MDRAGKPTPRDADFRAPDHPSRRTGSFIAVHARTITAVAVISGIVAIVALAGPSDDTTPGPGDSAPASEVAAERNRQQREATASNAAGSSNESADEQAVTTTGTDGRTYSCPSAVLDRVNVAKGRITRRERVLEARRAAVRRLERQYPSGKAPSAVVERYDELFARANAQVTWTNKAIAQYNRLLREACDPS